MPTGQRDQSAAALPIFGGCGLALTTTRLPRTVFTVRVAVVVVVAVTAVDGVGAVAAADVVVAVAAVDRVVAGPGADRTAGVSEIVTQIWDRDGVLVYYSRPGTGLPVPATEGYSNVIRDGHAWRKNGYEGSSA